MAQSAVGAGSADVATDQSPHLVQEFFNTFGGDFTIQRPKMTPPSATCITGPMVHTQAQAEKNDASFVANASGCPAAGEVARHDSSVVRTELSANSRYSSQGQSVPRSAGIPLRRSVHS